VTEELEFTQWLHTKKVYCIDCEHIDGSHLPHHPQAKPTWTFTHFNADGSPSPAIAGIETSPDLHTARITTESLRGKIVITVGYAVSSSVHVSQIFTVNVLAHPEVTPGTATLRISQCRNGPTH
jgi:hypothetical protein